MESRVRKLKSLLNDPQSAVHMTSLLDTLNSLVSTLEAAEFREQRNVKVFLGRYEKVMKEIRQLLVKPEDFDRVKTIGEGTFGRVDVVTHRVSGKVYAMKCLNKKQVAHMEGLWHERQIMAFNDSPWLVQLYAAFQDTQRLYLVMEFLPGGDLCNMISMFGMSEEKLRFYGAELVLAVDALHSRGFLHRNVKPSNVLFDQRGHLKLINYSIARRMDQRGLVKYKSAAGTKSYMAPEVLELEGSSSYLGREVDWWSTGVCIYEMFVGHNPFASRSETETEQKVKSFKKHIKIPPSREVSKETKDILLAFLCHAEQRLGRGGLEEIAQHPFFSNSKWTLDNIRQIDAPVVPKLKSETDTRYFRDIKRRSQGVETSLTPETFEENHLPFIGFTFLKEELELSSSSREERTSSPQEAHVIVHEGHELVPCKFRFPKWCSYCSRSLWGVFRPAPALRCLKCHISCHRSHLDESQAFTPCQG